MHVSIDNTMDRFTNKVCIFFWGGGSHVLLGEHCCCKVEFDLLKLKVKVVIESLKHRLFV